MQKPFAGELMHCVLCHDELMSRANVESNWTAIEIRGHRVYACPQCIPGAYPCLANEDVIAKNYERFIRKALEQIGAHV